MEGYGMEVKIMNVMNVMKTIKDDLRYLRESIDRIEALVNCWKEEGSSDEEEDSDEVTEDSQNDG